MSPTRRKARKKAAAPRLGADNPAARDEGPRLIPISDPKFEVPGAGYFLDLADQALGTKKAATPAEPMPKKRPRPGA